MKIIDAFWEKRNLNMSATEIIIDENDLKQEVSSLMSAINSICSEYEYVVLKMPPLYHKLIDYLNSSNLKFVETQIRYAISLQRFKTLKLDKCKKQNSFSIKCVDDRASYNQTINEIKKNLFTTDRIALDKRFGVNIANIRYANWLEDMFSISTSRLYNIYYNGDFFGFHAGEFDGTVYFGNFGSLASKYKSSMLGYYWAFLFLDYIKKDYDIVRFACSTNNPSVIRLWESLGAVTQSIQYVFVK